MSRVFWLGLFIVAMLMILATGVFLIGDKQFLFTPTYSLQAEFQNVSGLNNGSDVRVGGLREGTVRKINLPDRPDGKVSVLMKMDLSTREIIRKDSVVTIKTEGLLGTKYIDISFGSKDAVVIQNGDSLRTEVPMDMTAVANSIADQTKAGLATFQEDMEALKHNFLLRGYFNNRGYEDSGDLTKHAISRLPAKPRSKEFDFDAGELFDKPDNAKLKNQKALSEAGKFLEQNRFGLVVVASSETIGDSEKDRTLTQARAVVIRDFLVQNFKLDDTRVKTIGLGKVKSAQGNSRIQILIYPVEPNAPAGRNQSANSR
jgi:outer membrane protein OmpA-like peptidoglycan-associated protein